MPPERFLRDALDAGLHGAGIGGQRHDLPEEFHRSAGVSAREQALGFFLLFPEIPLFLLSLDAVSDGLHPRVQFFLAGSRPFPRELERLLRSLQIPTPLALGGHADVRLERGLVHLRRPPVHLGGILGEFARDPEGLEGAADVPVGEPALGFGLVSTELGTPGKRLLPFLQAFPPGLQLPGTVGIPRPGLLHQREGRLEVPLSRLRLRGREALVHLLLDPRVQGPARLLGILGERRGPAKHFQAFLDLPRGDTFLALGLEGLAFLRLAGGLDRSLQRGDALGHLRVGIGRPFPRFLRAGQGPLQIPCALQPPAVREHLGLAFTADLFDPLAQGPGIRKMGPRLLHHAQGATAVSRFQQGLRLRRHGFDLRGEAGLLFSRLDLPQPRADFLLTPLAPFASRFQRFTGLFQIAARQGLLGNADEPAELALPDLGDASIHEPGILAEAPGARQRFDRGPRIPLREPIARLLLEPAEFLFPARRLQPLVEAGDPRLQGRDVPFDSVAFRALPRDDGPLEVGGLFLRFALVAEMIEERFPHLGLHGVGAGGILRGLPRVARLEEGLSLVALHRERPGFGSGLLEGVPSTGRPRPRLEFPKPLLDPGGFRRPQGSPAFLDAFQRGVEIGLLGPFAHVLLEGREGVGEEGFDAGGDFGGIQVPDGLHARHGFLEAVLGGKFGSGGGGGLDLVPRLPLFRLPHAFRRLLVEGSGLLLLGPGGGESVGVGGAPKIPGLFTFPGLLEVARLLAVPDLPDPVVDRAGILGERAGFFELAHAPLGVAPLQGLLRSGHGRGKALVPSLFPDGPAHVADAVVELLLAVLRPLPGPFEDVQGALQIGSGFGFLRLPDGGVVLLLDGGVDEGFDLSDVFRPGLGGRHAVDAAPDLSGADEFFRLLEKFPDLAALPGFLQAGFDVGDAVFDGTDLGVRREFAGRAELGQHLLHPVLLFELVRLGPVPAEEVGGDPLDAFMDAFGLVREIEGVLELLEGRLLVALGEKVVGLVLEGLHLGVALGPSLEGCRLLVERLDARRELPGTAAGLDGPLEIVDPFLLPGLDHAAVVGRLPEAGAFLAERLVAAQHRGEFLDDLRRAHDVAFLLEVLRRGEVSVRVDPQVHGMLEFFHGAMDGGGIVEEVPPVAQEADAPLEIPGQRHLQRMPLPLLPGLGPEGRDHLVHVRGIVRKPPGDAADVQRPLEVAGTRLFADLLLVPPVLHDAVLFPDPPVEIADGGVHFLRVLGVGAGLVARVESALEVSLGRFPGGLVHVEAMAPRVGLRLRRRRRRAKPLRRERDGGKIDVPAQEVASNPLRLLLRDVALEHHDPVKGVLHPRLLLEAGEQVETFLDLFRGRVSLFDGIFGEIQIDLRSHGRLGKKRLAVPGCPPGPPREGVETV